MKRFTQTVITCLAAFVMIFASGCTTSPTAPVHKVPVIVKFITPSAEEISGSNKIEVSITNIKTGQVFAATIDSPEEIVFPDRIFYSLQRSIELPNGPIGETAEYLLSATYLGINDSRSEPSQDVSHMVTVNGMSLSYGNSDGMYFAITCEGDIKPYPETSPIPTILMNSRPYFGVSSLWIGQFTGGAVSVSVEELTSNEAGLSIWRPVFMSYDWSSQGLLPITHFSKMVTPEMGWNTYAQLRPISSDKFVRVKVIIDYPRGASQIVTDQILLVGSGSEWFGPSSSSGYRIFRLSGGYDGKG